MRPRSPALVPGVVAALLVLYAAPARADGIELRWTDIAERVVARPHTVAELEAGVIALPTAPISAAQQGGKTPLGTIGKGDATMMIGAHVLYRGGREWALGAGTLFGPSPTSDTSYGDVSGLPRTHQRSYLFLGGEARYVPLHVNWFEGWVGLTSGVIIIADRFSTNTGTPVPPLLGTRESTISTQGFAFGVEAGLEWMFADRWIAGFTARADQWLLPNTRQCSPIKDCATLNGTVEAFELGLTIGYRLPL